MKYQGSLSSLSHEHQILDAFEIGSRVCLRWEMVLIADQGGFWKCYSAMSERISFDGSKSMWNLHYQIVTCFSLQSWLFRNTLKLFQVWQDVTLKMSSQSSELLSSLSPQRLRLSPGRWTPNREGIKRKYQCGNVFLCWSYLEIFNMNLNTVPEA